MSAASILSSLIRKTHPHLAPEVGVDSIDTAIPKIAEVVDDLQRQVDDLTHRLHIALHQNIVATIATGGSGASTAKPLSVCIPYAGTWEYFIDTQGDLTLKCYSHAQNPQPPPTSKYWIVVHDSGTLAGPDIDNLTFTADSSGAQSVHSYQSPWYHVGTGANNGQTITCTPGIAAPAVAEEAPSEEASEGSRHRCNCPREAFALNGAGCSCGGV